VLARFFSWLYGLLTREEDRWDTYKPSQRAIFNYFNGERMVKADPLVLWKKVMDKAPDLDIDFKVSKSPSKNADQAHQNLIKNIRTMFNIKQLENGIEPNDTLTDNECIDLVNKFLTYCGWVKKNSSNSATPATATSPSTNSPTSNGEVPPTPSTSDSGSTVPATPTDGLAPLQPGLSSDSAPILDSTTGKT
jgi:hypothetical protein